ncbi:Uncharacterised protein [Mycobacteroides abscessus subsp. bolletii]|uniref:hypothetical protein n=1 Tax=Mycobacteroides abscessus TaxID=36809 RepID=UPI0009A8B558|nr:hypothetical protein [Mycobacteroides abscessus]MBE5500454.1 hypothetical protein [Mycobacteroides abscessus]SKS24460.1 Uncharacterised protein [Mycobacteroides abscessus subsp. bolletii]SKS46359.1 Uncharacterised protein [Mycobacteroides abscessus subsp. bolletii]
MRVLITEPDDTEKLIELAVIPGKGEEIKHDGAYFTVNHVIHFPLPAEYAAHLFLDLSGDQ